MHQSIILPGQKTPGWPKQKRVRQLPTGNLKEILLTKWKEDVHFVQYAVIPEIGPYRYNNEIFTAPEYEECKRNGIYIQQIAVAFDVDSPAKKSTEPGAVDRWFEDERQKISKLQQTFPGGLIWRTKGGWRGCWYLQRRIITADDTATWRRDYLAAIVYLEREFGIIADPACNDWNRLHRVPFGIRNTEAQYGWGEAETRETIGWLEEGKIFDLAGVSSEVDRKEAKRRHISAWKSPPTARRVNKQDSPADESSGFMLDGQGVWERALRKRNAIIRELAPGKWAIICPNAHLHTTAGNETSTVLYAPGPGEVIGHPYCSHHHCQNLDFKVAFGIGSEEWVLLTREATSEAVKAQEATPIAQVVSEPQETPEEVERRVVSTLIPGKNGVEVDGCPENVARLLVHHPDWSGLLVYDSFRHEKFWTRVPDLLSNIHKFDKRVLDVDSAKIQGWFLSGSKNRPRINVTLESVRVGLELACHENVYDSLREHVLKYKNIWDGTPRLNKWLTYYMGAEDTPLNNAIGEKWLVAAVARALNPGCVADMMPILEGAQEIGKNYMLDIMFGDFVVVPHGLKIGSKDFEQKCADSWLVHDDELASTQAAGLEITKSWLTQKYCKFRKAHAIDFITVPRRFIIVGSTNKQRYLRDEENRRFWPIYLFKLNDSALIRDRDQIWAEAIWHYETGYEYRITKQHELWDALADVHASKKEANLFEDEVRRLINTGKITAPFQLVDVFKALDIRSERWTDHALMQKVSAAVKSIGYVSKRLQNRGLRGVWWFAQDMN